MSNVVRATAALAQVFNTEGLPKPIRDEIETALNTPAVDPVAVALAIALDESAPQGQRIQAVRDLIDIIRGP